MPRPAAALTGVLLLAFSPALTGCAEDAAPALSAEHAFIPEPVDTRMAGGFLTIRNSGGADDTLTAVTSDLAATVELHETVDDRMRPVESFPVPAGGTLDLRRGGHHLMLLDLTHKPLPGDRISLELHFEESDPITLDVPVEAATYRGK
ncbi:copper chaperone PCu(A)C [Streptomyces sp. ACA25]|nr:copper chaperone PCu(A)C [Streptomyces sp. ACA25]MDB1086186.1 copper chaperone PCu(A)C [Streptomyces sp. ACA25]